MIISPIVHPGCIVADLITQLKYREPVCKASPTSVDKFTSFKRVLIKLQHLKITGKDSRNSPSLPKFSCGNELQPACETNCFRDCKHCHKTVNLLETKQEI